MSTDQLPKAVQAPTEGEFHIAGTAHTLKWKKVAPYTVDATCACGNWNGIFANRDGAWQSFFNHSRGTA